MGAITSRPSVFSKAVTAITASVCGMLAVTAVLAGCSTSAKDSWAGRGRPVTFANEPVPSPPPDTLVNGVGGLRVVLEGRVIAAAGLIRPVTSECDTTVIEPAFTCRVTYLGEVVTYQVTTKPDSQGTYTWQAKPDALIATRTGIEAAMWHKYATRATAMRCDTPFPARQRVDPRTSLRHRCYFKPTLGDKAFGKDSGNAARTVAVKITIYDGWIRLDEITQ
jgi:hypothetical protein